MSCPEIVQISLGIWNKLEQMRTRRPGWGAATPYQSVRHLRNSGDRKHAPDSDPGMCIQQTVMPALQLRNVPDSEPIVDAGTK